ncbi:hypothetical protein PIB30_111407, partial [Stylosanthes scabra]|nr:hypothetical protein [Stylosanthes scabra]
AAQNVANRGGSTRKSFLSPTRRSDGSALKSSAVKSQHANSNCSPKQDCHFDDNNVRPSSPVSGGVDNCGFGCNLDDGCDAFRDSDNSDVDDDDPWKPLNPHEPGNLKVKPFRKVKELKKNGINVRRRVSMSILFPPAKLHGPISPELMTMWEMRHHAHERQKDSESIPLYGKLRQSLMGEGSKTGGAFFNTEADNDEHEFDTGNPDFDMPGDAYMDEDLPPCNKENETNDVHAEDDGAVDNDYPNSQQSLEDLCRSHL